MIDNRLTDAETRAFERDGYVPDEDAVRVDYRELLADMQADSRSSNDSRMDAGYEDVELVGWATRPRMPAIWRTRVELTWDTPGVVDRSRVSTSADSVRFVAAICAS